MVTLASNVFLSPLSFQQSLMISILILIITINTNIVYSNAANSSSIIGSLLLTSFITFFQLFDCKIYFIFCLLG